MARQCPSGQGGSTRDSTSRCIDGGIAGERLDPDTYHWASNLLKKPDFASAAVFPTPWQAFGFGKPYARGINDSAKALLKRAIDNYKNREKSVNDGIWAAKYLIDQGYAEPRKIAAWGGSYGGFMTMAVITEAPELFGAACDVVGVVNFETFLEQTKDYRRALREVDLQGRAQADDVLGREADPARRGHRRARLAPGRE